MKKYLLYAMSLFIAGCSFTACTNEEDDIFDASPADRLNQAKEDYTNLLCSAPNGWAMQYFVDNVNEGGYTYLMKFDKNTSVKIAGNNSWIGNTYKEETSMYELIADNGPVLTFNTFNNVFHVFADPEDVGSTADNEQGYGHRGDYEFIVMEAAADRIRLKGKKFGMEVIMTPLAEDADWTEYLANIKSKARSIFNDKFDPLVLDLGEKRFIVTKASTGVFNMYPEGGDAITETVLYPYLINPEGIRFYKPVEDTGVQQIYFNDNGSFSLKDSDADCLVNSMSLNKIFMVKTFTWRLTAENATGKFAAILETLAAETKSKLKKNFNSIDLVYVANEGKYALQFRNSGSTAAAYIWGDETAADDGVTLNLNYSTSEGNTNGKNRLRDLPSLTDLINAINASTFVTTAENPLAPTVIKIVDKANEGDTITLTLV